MLPSVSAAADASPPRRDRAVRAQVALSGPSVTLDPRNNAVRPDLADIRLAGQVFAPHYAAPVPRVVAEPAELRLAREQGSEVLVMLGPGAPFDLLDVMGDDAWGVAPDAQLVGYIDAALLVAVAR